ncbi:unnamed protein product [Clonostachys rosea]|uniref:Peptidase C14 caspase domain-containing protein n=1 Tax=Bionectria ochroleuca TaxID=29856 RepID=A0ABY6UC39_BIOOC|nr:unnamed protein product [Clonostachys rosea]
MWSQPIDGQTLGSPTGLLGTETLTMTGTKRALLIGSTYDGLRGPPNDVEDMAEALGKWGFTTINKCVGEDATYDGILTAWKETIKNTSSEDTVVIYYSGHGGLVEDAAPDPDESTPARYQFIVPVDYLATPEGGGEAIFNGILDVQISHFLHEITKITHHVTTIFDCCHSGSMARDPVHSDLAKVRSVGKVRHDKISERVESLRRERSLPLSDRALDEDGNRFVVRIAATSSSLPAWEDCSRDTWAGSMTKALVQALKEALSDSNEHSEHTAAASWKTIVTLVRERVKVDFPQQDPHVDGPSVRRLFSLEESNTTSFVLKKEEDCVMLQAGRIAGVHEDNVYDLMPHGSEHVDKKKRIGRATVRDVLSLKSGVELELFPAKDPIPKSGVVAFLEHEAFPKWPVQVPKGSEELCRAVQGSKYIRASAEGAKESPVAKFWREGDDWTLSSNALSAEWDVRILTINTSKETSAPQCYEKLVQAADNLARAQRLLALVPGDDEKLDDDVAIEIVQVKKRRPGDLIPIDGSGSMAEGDRIFFLLRNRSKKTLYASIYNINVYGHISCVHSRKTTSIELLPLQCKAVGAGRMFGKRYAHLEGSTWPSDAQADGLPISWPEGISRDQQICDRLVVILTEERVDLGHLVSHQGDKASRGPDPATASSLELLAYEIGSGQKRNIGTANEEHQCFATISIVLQLEPRKMSLNDLPSVEDLPESRGLIQQPPSVERDARVRASMLGHSPSIS